MRWRRWWGNKTSGESKNVENKDFPEVVVSSESDKEKILEMFKKMEKKFEVNTRK